MIYYIFKEGFVFKRFFLLFFFALTLLEWKNDKFQTSPEISGIFQNI